MSIIPLPRLTSVKKLFIYILLHSTLYYIVPCDILHVEDGSPREALIKSLSNESVLP
jgi:hypothetical protein